jgi:hypothetical protein
LLLVAFGIVVSLVPGVPPGRYTLAIIYAVIGVAVGGFSRPDTAAEWGLLAASLVLSVVVGLARGRLTRVWADISDDGGFGEILIMIAVMVAFQAELIWRRARALGARASSRPSAVGAQR